MSDMKSAEPMIPRDYESETYDRWFIETLEEISPLFKVDRIYHRPEQDVYRPTFEVQEEHPTAAPGLYEIYFRYSVLYANKFLGSGYEPAVKDIFESSIRAITGVFHAN